MLGGMLIFARFLDTFLDVFEILYVPHEDETKLEELTFWLRNLEKFRGKSLPNTLHHKILEQFAF